MSTPADTDIYLVIRGGTSYQVTYETIMSTLEDTDLLLVNRGTLSYQITAADFKSGVVPPADPLVVNASLSTSTAEVGTAINVNVSISGGTTPYSNTYQWKSKNPSGTISDIGGATSVSYTPVTGDVGDTLACQVTVNDDGSQSETVTTTFTQAVVEPGAGLVKASTRFNPAYDSYLNWTPTSVGNRRTWTWSGWVKRGNIPGTSANMGLFSQDSNCYFRFSDDNGGDSFRWVETGNYDLISERLFRDPAAWQHIVVAIDSSIADPAGSPAGSDRVKIYINNERITDWQTSVWPGFEHDFDIGNAGPHQIASCQTSNYFDGLMSDIYFVDGQQLTPGDFAEPDATTGQWVPKEFTGSYGTNGFHLAMDPAETGTIYSDDVTGANNPANAFDGSLSTYITNTGSAGTPIVLTHTLDNVTSFRYYTGNGSSHNVAFNGGSAITDSASSGWRTVTAPSSITSISWIHSNQPANTVAINAIEINGKILVDHTAIGYDSSGQKNHWHENNLIADAGAVYSDNLSLSAGTWGSGQGATQAFNGVAGTGTNMAQRGDAGSGTITWTFSGLSGLCRVYIGNDGGTVTDGNNVNRGNNEATGEHPGWVTCSGDIENYGGSIVISVPSDAPSLGAIEVAGSILTDGFQLDLLDDVPGAPYDNSANGGGNYATFNPLVLINGGSSVFSDGNLSIRGGSTNGASGSTINPTSGKYYFELDIQYVSGQSQGNMGVGIVNELDYGVGNPAANSYPSTLCGFYTRTEINSVVNGSETGAQTTEPTVNYRWGLKVDYDTKDITLYLNGSPGNTVSFSSVTNPLLYFFWGNTNNTMVVNFGQRDFQETVPTGFKSLNTFNLAPPLIDDPSEHFDVKLYPGTAAIQPVTGVGFQPELVWLKRMDDAGNHNIQDAVRGAAYFLQSDYEGGESNSGSRLASFDTDGFTLTSDNGANTSGGSYVSWLWDAGDAANTTPVSVGSLNSVALNINQTWSSGMKTSDTATATYSTSGRTTTMGYGSNTDPFDADQTNFIYGTTGIAGTWLYLEFSSALSNVTSISFSTEYSCPSSIIKLNGTDVAVDQTAAGGFREVTVTGTIPASLTEIAIQGNGGSSRLKWVKIDGKLLIDSGVTYNLPSIASEYKANTAAGFSIITATGSSSTAHTVGHGCNSPPDLIIAKLREAAGNGYNQDWQVYHKSLGNTKGLHLNSNGGVETTSSLWNDTSPTSSVFSIGGSSRWDGDFVAYCWSEVPGYSKFGSYVGNNADNFIYLGFRARWVMTKSSNDYANWNIVDTTRDPYNRATEVLAASNANKTLDNSVTGFDICSNGITLKPDANGQHNYNNITFIYAAFAETPFRYANAR